MKKILAVGMLFCLISITGCTLPQRGEGPSILTAAQLTEPAWIRNGEPVIFEAEDWFPTDEVENLLDVEVFQAGTYRDVPLFIEKSDVRPFDRIYTFFSKNRYRAFEQ
jgi:hypothetical protein